MFVNSGFAKRSNNVQLDRVTADIIGTSEVSVLTVSMLSRLILGENVWVVGEEN